MPGLHCQGSCLGVSPELRRSSCNQTIAANRIKRSTQQTAQFPLWRGECVAEAIVPFPGKWWQSWNGSSPVSFATSSVQNSLGEEGKDTVFLQESSPSDLQDPSIISPPSFWLWLCSVASMSGCSVLKMIVCKLEGQQARQTTVDAKSRKKC